MHLNFHFTAVETLWTITFAAQLVLLVVLLGRDRVKRFPWFSLAIALMALRLLSMKLLSGRMPTYTLNAIFIAMADVSAIVGALVVVEMARRAFAGVRRITWLAGTLAVLLVGLGILAAWGPWPAWKTLTADSTLAILRLMQMGAQKLDMLVDLLTVELGLLVVLLGRRTGAGWRTHTQRIVIGLSTASLAQLVVEGLWQYIAHTVPPPRTQAEFDHIIGLRDKLFNANGALFCAVLIWWIACLWIDEPGAIEPEQATPRPEYLLPEDETPADHEADAKADAESGEGTQGEA